MSTYATLSIDIETVKTGYHLTINGWFVGAFQTVAALQEKVSEMIARHTH